MEERRQQKREGGIKEMATIVAIVAVVALVLYVAGIGCPIIIKNTNMLAAAYNNYATR